MNLYGFASGDPVNFSDPFGLCATPATAVVCLAAAKQTGAALVASGVAIGTAATVTGAALTQAATIVGGALTEAGNAITSSFVVTAKGTAIALSQARMALSFAAAGFPSEPTSSPGVEYTLPGGMQVRLMEPAGGAPRRASFENANTQPVTPDGGAPQPPRGLTAAERRQYVRDRTHVIQVP